MPYKKVIHWVPTDSNKTRCGLNAFAIRETSLTERKGEANCEACLNWKPKEKPLPDLRPN